MLPKPVIDKFNELAAALTRESALALAQELWDIVHNLIPGFPVWPNWETYSLQQIKETCSVGIYAVTDWPYEG